MREWIQLVNSLGLRVTISRIISRRLCPSLPTPAAECPKHLKGVTRDSVSAIPAPGRVTIKPHSRRWRTG